MCGTWTEKLPGAERGCGIVVSIAFVIPAWRVCGSHSCSGVKQWGKSLVHSLALTPGESGCGLNTDKPSLDEICGLMMGNQQLASSVGLSAIEHQRWHVGLGQQGHEGLCVLPRARGKAGKDQSRNPVCTAQPAAAEGSFEVPFPGGR